MGYYKPSGKVDFPLTLLGTLIGAVVIAVLAYGYAFITELNPFIYVNFLVTIAYVFLVAFMIGIVRRMGKMRSSKGILIMSGILSLFGLAAVWVSFVSVVFEDGIAEVLANFGHRMEILYHRSFSIGRALRSSSIEFSGGMLMALWIVEALILAAGPVFMIYFGTKDDSVFCEDCNKWADQEKKYLKRSETVLDQQNIEDLIRSNRVHHLLDLATETNPEGLGEHYEITFTACELCNKAHYLSVSKIVNTTNDKGEIDKDETLIMPFYELDYHAVPKVVLAAQPVSK